MADQEFVGIKSVDAIPGVEAIASTLYNTSGDTPLAATTVPRGAAKLNIFIDLTVVGADANETLDIALEWSPDEGATFFVPDVGADTFAQMLQTVGAQRRAKQFTVLAETYRLVLTLAGTTPEFTLAVDHAGVYA